MSDYVFGIHAVESLLNKQSQQVALLEFQDGRDDKRLSQIKQLADSLGIRCVFLPRRELDQKVNGRHQGIVATVEGRQHQQLELKQLLETIGPDSLFLVLDGITDPHNLGACLRTADAAGVDAVIVPKDKSAPLNATARKVACGAAETVPFFAVTNLARCLRQLQDAGLWLVGTAGEAGQSLYQMDFKQPVALVMGSEGDGLRALTREHCDYLVNLPMAGDVSSLNVSVATGVCLFEIVRQRQAI